MSHSDEPKLYETSIYGKTVGLNNVFVVDGSVLPKIAAKPLTFTIMANADRIARNLIKECHNN